MGTSGAQKLMSKKGRVSDNSGSGYSKSSGKNEKHSNIKAREAAKGKMEAAQEKLKTMDNAGETHHRR